LPEPDRAIVVGTDGSKTASIAVERAGALAKLLGATVHLVCAFRPVSSKSWGVESGQTYDDAHRDALAILEEAARDLRTAGVSFDSHAAHGDAAEMLLEVAEANHAQLIVVGNKGMAGARRYLLGSVPNKLSHHASCSVLIMHTK
jgi:nucleotide-binding universal stress UspA family protein